MTTTAEPSPYLSLVLQSRLTPWLAQQPGMPVGAVVEVLGTEVAVTVDGEPVKLSRATEEALAREQKRILGPDERRWARLWATNELEWPEAWVASQLDYLPELKKARRVERKVGVRPIVDVYVKVEGKNPVAAVEAYEGIVVSTLDRLRARWEIRGEKWTTNEEKKRPVGPIRVPMPGRVAGEAVKTALARDWPDWIVDVGEEELAVSVPRTELMADDLVRRVVQWY